MATVYPSSWFDYSSSDNTFTVEISILSHATKGRPFYKTEDGNDGFIMASGKSGAEAHFEASSIAMDADQEDIISWTLVPTKSTVARLPRLQGSKIIVYNT
jgi:hypothetical protein